jgi:hypothetical protein
MVDSQPISPLTKGDIGAEGSTATFFAGLVYVSVDFARLNINSEFKRFLLLFHFFNFWHIFNLKTLTIPYVLI